MNPSEFNGQIYYGTKAGSELKTCIKYAKSSIKIMSPYLEPALVDDLRIKQSQGVKIQIITTEETETTKSDRSVLAGFVDQNCITDEKALSKYKRYKLISTISSWITAIAICYALYKLKHIELYAIPVIFFIISKYFANAKKRLRIFTYTYTKNIPFIAFLSPNVHPEYRTDPRCKFFHTKLYIIDDVLITGSLNYTFSGLTYNFETMLKSNDSAVVQNGNAIFDDLFEAGYYYIYQTETIGKKHMFEKIYPD